MSIETQAFRLAQRLVDNFNDLQQLDDIGQSWDLAQKSALRCAKEMMKVYKHSMDGWHYFDDDYENYEKVLKQLPKKIRNYKPD